MTERRFDGRVAVITGAGRGLGREYALLLAAKGARVVVNDVGGTMAGGDTDDRPADSVVQEIRAAGGEAIANTDSVATPAGGQAIIQAAMDHYGRVDILIHNAGNVRYGSLEELSQDDFESVVDVHLMGAFHVVRPAFPIMAKAGYGRVVLTSSIGGIYGTHNVANYGVSKAGTIGLNNVIAIEGSDKGIKSNVILPGAVTRMADGLDTSQYPPMGADMVSPVVGWLAHESCSVSGELYISIAGRVARALVAETEGVYRPNWSIDEVADNIDAIRNTDNLWLLPPVPSGYMDHLEKSFQMARDGMEK
ncbi:SDR family NAD(P)-dependent oxidoreductase [Aestuariicella hydrocarbonica]|uniref:SDR family NAD(P)-dependent oxidoreductase n=1 Tax=Pseudomaricurvus hydrocarbonicus TaxID=1470433 RepID=A0A9E5T3T0_9GAMM|nr:SDR family NAD(P)-dependent oxidoreductase [Aestuariicella hydrocarbonica]NHO67428.1 SDR family NAD(P)-dependent oxidoreductase [Aestuariicella hydrocarbonica]